MIGYITLGSNDVQTSAKFYDQLFSEVGASRLWDTPAFVAWSKGDDSPFFAITTPHDKEAATVGNGVMIAIQAANQAAVDLIHSKALALGSKNEGDPGLRQAGYYCAYLRDLDGNKLNFYCVEK
ncbi:MAG: VOC family protein [Pseudomonadales bacterium]|nr:VOC family protein [Pseudomonadales bacterium]